MTVESSAPLTSSTAVYEAPLRASVIQEKLTNNCTKTSSAQRGSVASNVALLQAFAAEADKGQAKTEQVLALQILPLVRDIQQMVALVDESATKYEAAVLSNERLHQLLAARVSSDAADTH